MPKRSPFRYFKTSPEVIRLAVMLYVRFPLSLRNVEDLLHERGVNISHETVRFWWNRFGPMVLSEENGLRRAGRLRASSAQDSPHRQKMKRPPCGAFYFSRRVWLRMRTLFDQRSRAAASWRGSAAGATQSHPLRQNTKSPLIGLFYFLVADLVRSRTDRLACYSLWLNLKIRAPLCLPAS